MFIRLIVGFSGIRPKYRQCMSSIYRLTCSPGSAHWGVLASAAISQISELDLVRDLNGACGLSADPTRAAALPRLERLISRPQWEKALLSPCSFSHGANASILSRSRALDLTKLLSRHCLHVMLDCHRPRRR